MVAADRAHRVADDAGFRVAGGIGVVAPRRERAARRQIQQRRRRSPDLRQLAARLGARGQRIEQALRIRMTRVAQHRHRRPCLDDPARVHHRDPVGERRHGRQIVTDPDERGADLADEGLHLGQYLRLDRHVERRRRLVGDDQRRAVQERDRDRHALPHAARELVRVRLEPPPGVRQPDDGQHLDAARAQRRGGKPLVRRHREPHLLGDGEHRIQRRRRILEHHREAPAAHPAQLGGIHADQLAILEPDRAADNAAGRIDEPQQREAGDGLARAALADEAQHLARAQRERNAIDRLDHAGAREEMRGEVADLEQRHRDVYPLGAARRPPGGGHVRAWGGPARSPLSRD